MKQRYSAWRVPVIAAGVIILLVAVVFGWLFFSHNHHWVSPSDFKNSCWVSEDPAIELAVDGSGVCTVEFTLDGEMVTVKEVREGGRVFWIVNRRFTETLLTGSYKCTDDQYSIKVEISSSRYNTGSDVFNGEYAVLSFHKVS